MLYTSSVTKKKSNMRAVKSNEGSGSWFLRIWNLVFLLGVSMVGKGCHGLAFNNHNHEKNMISSRRGWFVQTVTAAMVVTGQGGVANAASSEESSSSGGSKFQRYPQIRFIASLGDPKASSGSDGAETWGLWRDDPGPRGVFLKNYQDRILKHDNVAPAGWKFSPQDWWLEEHGLIMSSPEPLPLKSYNPNTKEILPYKRYIVTGDREVTSILTVHSNGKWELSKGTLYDVTHLPCRSARYTSSSSTTCSPTNANQKDFPVTPGATMPSVTGCNKQDYGVLFVLGEEKFL